MSRRKRRMPVSQAVLRFMIAILTLALLAGIALFFLRVGRDDGERPYLPTGTGEPVTLPPVTPTPAPSPEESATPEPTAVPEPTATPEPTLQPVPTPVPTRIPQSLYSATRTGFRLPEQATDGSVGITKSYVSAADGYSVMELAGWGYAQLEWFDGSECGTYLIVTDTASGKQTAYLSASADGISGRNHVGAVCKNPSAADWHVYVDVSGYESGIYRVSLALLYRNGKNDEIRHYAFAEPDTFTVYDGEIIIPVTAAGAEEE